MTIFKSADYYPATSTAYSEQDLNMEPKPMRVAIAEKCEQIKNMLQDKNEKYGNSATEPVRIFSKSNPIEGLLVRCDDKLSRIKTTGLRESGEDQILDLIGYLILISIQIDNEG